ncbi:polygalacturonase-like [Impatiens glandulifera]|uniref:polygalacturonase-like n=1 Tax=Impatiens glandulifera TaxID=253017 RepID=UPI001FB15462|nr:polygalacturonase-like [Impatiens glandulifera]
MLSRFLTLLFTFVSILSMEAVVATTYNVVSYGAKSDGKTDSTKAFLSAWSSACSSSDSSSIYVPPGEYLIGSIARFNGETCKSNDITIRIDGTLLAPSDYEALGNGGNWIVFERVDGVSIYGGTLDARGAGLWACKASKNRCPSGVTSLELSQSNNIFVSGLTSLNSQMFHITVFGCNNVKLQGLKVSAPAESPNTDGIHVSSSSGVTITNTRIGTGDDCISIGPGSRNLWFENIACGPGHGISIGSLGGNSLVAGVQNVTVTTATFTGTENGVRIKTWAEAGLGFVRNVVFEHATMVNVQNPIVIDQHYCPGSNNCPNQASGIKISDVTYQDIHGTSATEVAVKFECSKANPCSGITLNDVDLTYGKASAESSCSNARGSASGVVLPTSCL